VVSDVSRLSFDPPPRVNSSLVTMRWKRTLSAEQTAMIKRIFSQKRRTVRAALKSLGPATPPSAPGPGENVALQCRVNSLRPESVLAMIQVLAREDRPQEGQA
jgi:16S rRNA A1518/A1519 N6-dimethyltransferase RsmA/KsgA/DIM1 with predicted DNA glycosylase/AP lyase activity